MSDGESDEHLAGLIAEVREAERIFDEIAAARRLQPPPFQPPEGNPWFCFNCSAAGPGTHASMPV